jgi:plasmid stabilization system protein ParE
VAFRLAARARRDLDTVLGYSLEQYGRDAADRYGLLLTTAMIEIGRQP